MPSIEAIRDKFEQQQFEFSQDAVDRMILRYITVSEVQQAIANGEVIEDYPQDKYGPSCLISGFTTNDRPLHIQCSYPSRPLIKVVTVYEPSPDDWLNFKVRVK
jgi:hypothetical protein